MTRARSSRKYMHVTDHGRVRIVKDAPVDDIAKEIVEWIKS